MLPDRLLLEDFAELAVDADVGFNEAHKQQCKAAVLSWNQGGLIELESRTRGVAIPNIFKFYKFNTSPARERPHDAFFRERRGDVVSRAPQAPSAILVPQTYFYVRRTQVNAMLPLLAGLSFVGLGPGLWLDRSREESTVLHEVDTPSADSLPATQRFKRASLQQSHEFFDTVSRTSLSFGNTFKVLQESGDLEKNGLNGYTIEEVQAALLKLKGSRIVFRLKPVESPQQGRLSFPLPWVRG